MGTQNPTGAIRAVQCSAVQCMDPARSSVPVPYLGDPYVCGLMLCITDWVALARLLLRQRCAHHGGVVSGHTRKTNMTTASSLLASDAFFRFLVFITLIPPPPPPPPLPPG